MVIEAYISVMTRVTYRVQLSIFTKLLKDLRIRGYVVYFITSCLNGRR